jgi:hypothetical protein
VISDKLKSWNGAIVHLVPKRGEPFVDSAAHVFETADGFAYVNPGYFYQETSHLNNFHRIEAELKGDGDRITFDGPDYSGHIEEWTAEVPQLKSAGDALYRYEMELEGKGISYEDARARLLALLEDDLA